jgi:Tfp pilus assembly protein PilF
MAILAFACCCGCQTIGAWMPKHDKVTEARENEAHKTALTMDPTPEQKLNVQLAVAESLETENQADQAVKIYLNAIKKNGNCVVAYQRLGMLYAQKGEWELSQKYFDIAIKKDPKNPELECDQGYAFYLQHRDQEAEQRFRHALAIEPEFTRAHNNLGMLCARRGQENDALKEFAAAGCSEAQAHANLGLVYAMENHLREARDHYRIALAADPNLAVAKNGMAVLDSVDKNLAHGAAPSEAPIAEAKLSLPAGTTTF